jgi:hypothetical protein
VLEDSNDNEKNKSRKYKLSLLSLLLITAGFAVIEGLHLPHVAFGEFIAGVLGVLALYLGGNVTNKYVVSKSLAKGDDHGANKQ